MVALFTDAAKAFELEHTLKAPVRDRTELGHLRGKREDDGFHTDELRTFEPVVFAHVADFFENLFEGTHLSCLIEEEACGLNEISLRLLLSGTAGGDIELWRIRHVRGPSLKT
jgi:hypothetical protein